MSGVSYRFPATAVGAIGPASLASQNPEMRARLRARAQSRADAGEPILAAELYEEAGDFLTAAGLHEAHGDVLRAADLLVRGAAPRRAADLLVAALAGQAGPRLAAVDARRACRWAGELFSAEGRVDRAVQVLRWGGELEFAASLLEKAQRWDDAERLHIELGNLLAAAEAARARGDDRRHHELMGRRAERDGRLLDGARHFEEAGNVFEAVRLYETVGAIDRAADAAEKGELWEAAARLRERLGQVERAVLCLEWAGRSEEARALRFRHAAARMDGPTPGGRHLDAAVAALARARAGDPQLYMEAIGHLEQVAPDSRDYLAARTMLGEVLSERGENQRALVVLQNLFLGVAPSPAHVPAIYQYGRLLEQEGYLAGARNAYRTVAAFESSYRDVRARLARLRETDRSQSGFRSGPNTHTPDRPMLFVGPAPDQALARSESSVGMLPELTVDVDPRTLTADLLLEGGPSEPAPSRPSLLPAVRRDRGPDPLVGTVLRDRFRLERRVGRGAQASVYMARDQVLERAVAIKVLSEGMQPDERALSRFLREARMAARVRHANCLAIFDFGQERGLTFIAMEYFEGRTLREWIRKGPLEPLLAVRIARDVGAALGAVHEAGIVHRDVKPTNILLDASANVRLTDFGVAQLASDDSGHGMMVGTMKYMAPEQAHGKETDARADVFSLGAVLYEMLAGEPPFAGTLQALIKRVNKAPPELPPELDLPKELRDLVRTCMQKRAQHRYPDIAAMLDAIDEALVALEALR